MKITTTIKINAKPSVIWGILMDIEKYPEWNPFIKSVKTPFKLNQKNTIKIQTMTFKPVILALRENEELRWLGRLGFKGLFDGEHRFLLTANQDGSTTFEHSEAFSGLLVGLFKSKLLNDTKPGFEAMNRALKERAESWE